MENKEMEVLTVNEEVEVKESKLKKVFNKKNAKYAAAVVATGLAYVIGYKRGLSKSATVITETLVENVDDVVEAVM